MIFGHLWEEKIRCEHGKFFKYVIALLKILKCSDSSQLQNNIPEVEQHLPKKDIQ